MARYQQQATMLPGIGCACASSAAAMAWPVHFKEVPARKTAMRHDGGYSLYPPSNWIIPDTYTNSDKNTRL